MSSILYGGLDVHKDRIDIATANVGRDGEIRPGGQIGGDLVSPDKVLLLRNGIAYEGKSSWTAACLRWLASLKLPQPAQQIGFQENLHAITESGARIARLEQALRDQLSTWGLRPVVHALQALRGVQLIAAITLVAPNCRTSCASSTRAS